MEKSIENIWKTGFINESNSIPKIKNLDSLQSIYFIDQFKQRYQKNVFGLLLTATLVLLAFVLGGIPFIGLFMFGLFAALALMGRIEINKLEQLNKGASSYEYIQSFDNWLKQLLTKFAMVYRIWVPLLFIGFALALLKSNLFIPFLGETLMERCFGSSNGLLFGLPLIVIVGLLIAAILLSYFSTTLFKREIKSIYGDLIRQLDDLLKDLNELK